MEAGSTSSVAPERAPLPRKAPAPVPGLASVPPPGGLPMADVSGLSLSWFACALLALLASSLWLVLSPGLLAGEHSAPATVGWVHCLILGFLATTTFGAVYQLLPVVVGEPLVHPRLPWVHLPLHALGCLGLIHSFASANYSAVALSGGLLLLGFALFALNSLRTFARARRKDIVAYAFCAATVWLLLAAAAGLLAALNRRHGFFPQPTPVWLRLHAHLGLLGFFVTLLQGAGFRLLPMFTLGEVRNWDRVVLALALTQGGLIGLSFGWLEGLAAGRIVFAALICAGLLLSALEARSLLASRRKRVLDQGLQAFIVGGLALGLAAPLGFLLLATDWFDGALEGRVPLLYGLLVVGGALLPMVCGMLLKVFPFLVWMRAYAPRLGRGPLPLASQLPSPALEQSWLETHLLALVLLSLGLSRPEAFWLPAGALVLLLSQLLLLSNFVRIALHLRTRPATVKPRN